MVCPVSPGEARRFDRALYNALFRAGYSPMYGVPLIDADGALRRMSTQALQVIAKYLLAAVQSERLQFAATTKFHCIVMCIVDILNERRAYVP